MLPPKEPQVQQKMLEGAIPPPAKVDHIGRLTWQLIEQHDAELLEVEGKIPWVYLTATKTIWVPLQHRRDMDRNIQTYQTDGFEEMLMARRSSSDLIQAMHHMAISSRCNQLGVVKISQTLARVWNSDCNNALLHLLLKKTNIFSLNFDVADFGNHVHNFVAMLNNNIEKTGPCLAWLKYTIT